LGKKKVDSLLTFICSITGTKKLILMAGKKEIRAGRQKVQTERGGKDDWQRLVEKELRKKKLKKDRWQTRNFFNKLSQKKKRERRIKEKRMSGAGKRKREKK